MKETTREFFERFPLPWRMAGETVYAANEAVVWCNMRHYPYSTLENNDFDTLVEFINDAGIIVAP